MPDFTVFVLGAGASKEVGLPIGSELTEEIATLLDLRMDSMGQREAGDSAIYRAVGVRKTGLIPTSVRQLPQFKWVSFVVSSMLINNKSQKHEIQEFI